MRLKLALFALTALSAAAACLPASAQSYRSYDDGCSLQRKNSEAAGAVLGAVIGGVLGSNIAGHGHRGDGTAVGVGLGALTGAAAGSSTNCAPPPPPPRYGYGAAPYAGNAEPYPEDGGALAGAPRSSYAEDGVYDNRDSARMRHRHTRVYAGDTDTYKYQDDSAGRDCTTVSQVTKLPDGSSIQKPVEVCREARYGGWEVQN